MGNIQSRRGLLFFYAIFIGLAIAQIAILITFVVLLAVYAFNNPDAPAWHGYITAEQHSLYPSEEAAVAGGAKDVTNYHGKYVSWFTWGFVQMIAPTILLVLFLTTGLLKSVVGNFLYATTSCVIGCSSLAWFIVGLTLRYSTTGQFSSGVIVPPGTTEEAWKAAASAPGSLY